MSRASYYGSFAAYSTPLARALWACHAAYLDAGLSRAYASAFSARLYALRHCPVA